jgi:hypothetical protein
MTVSQLVLFTPGVRVIESSTFLLFRADIGAFEGKGIDCANKQDEMPEDENPYDRSAVLGNEDIWKQ